MAALWTGRYDSVNETTDKIEEFLKPLTSAPSEEFNRKKETPPPTNDDSTKSFEPQGSLAERIIWARQEQGTSPAVRDSKWVIAQACHLLTGLHEAVCLEQGEKPQGQASYSTSLFAGVYGLLDLIVLEGVYPSLSPGIVSIPERRGKSILFTKTSLHIPFPKDLRILEKVLYGTLDHLATDSHRGIQPLIRGRIMSDLVAAHADLAFSPARLITDRREALAKLQNVLNQVPLSTAYQVLSGLLRPQAPDWLRSGLSELLALLPTKPLGVRNVIEFIAASHNEGSADTSGGAQLPSQGPPLPFDALKQASKLLSAVPRSMPVEVYLDKVGPQLLSLLDGDAGSELAQVAAYVIADGFLGKRTLGAPGSPGWQFLVEPSQNAISPPPMLTRSVGQGDGLAKQQIISSDKQILQALKRLSALIRAYSNTALTGRLLRPLIRSLWGIATFDTSPIVDPAASVLARGLLQGFLTLSGGAVELSTIATDLLWDGPEAWAYSPGSEGGVAIVSRNTLSPAAIDVVLVLPKIDRRIDFLCKLITSSSIDDAVLGTLFFEQLKIWFEHKGQLDEHLVETARFRDPNQNLTTAKLVLALLDQFGAKIANHPENAISLIEQTISQKFESVIKESPRNLRTYSSMLTISRGDEKSADTSAMNVDESFSIALSLLSTLIDEPTFKLDVGNNTPLSRIEAMLRILDAQPPHSNAGSREAVARTLQMLRKAGPASTLATEKLTDASSSSMHELATQIRADLSSDLPPVRTSAIRLLQSQIRSPSFSLDVPASTIMLIDVIRTDPEDYVFLAAIQTLILLAQLRDARLVTRLVADAFQDAKEESGVDGRLRLGEAIIGMVNAIGLAANKPSNRQVIEIVVDTAIEVGGRRGVRGREQEERKRKDRLDRMRKKEAERAWGGDVPEDPTLDFNEEHADETPEQRARRMRELEAIESIVKGWENTGPEEDLRVRATALSIISEVLEHAIDLVSQQQVTNATDLALAVLVMETNVSQAILRRAAVLTFHALLRAMDRAYEQTHELAVGLEAARWLDVEKVLSLLRDADPDELVRGHASTVLEGLEAFRMKQILGVRSDAMQDALTPRFTLEGRLQGLDVDLDSAQAGDRKTKIQEIE